MKKIYTLCLLAMMACGYVSAQNLKMVQAPCTVHGQNELSINKFTSLGQSKLAKTIDSTTLPTEKSINRAIAIKSDEVEPVAAPASIEELVAKKWDCSFTSSTGAALMGNAVFEYYDEYDELYMVLDGYDFDIAVTYEDNKLVVSNAIGLMQTSSYIVAQYMLVLTNTGYSLLGSSVEMTYDENSNAFVLPEGYIIGHVAVSGTNILGVLGVVENLVVSVSAGDYSLNAVLEDECTPDNVFKVTINAGEDVAYVMGLLVNFDDDVTNYLSYLPTLGQRMTIGATYTVSPAVNTVVGPVTESGHAALMLAAYDADGNVKRTQNLSMIVILEGEDGWKDVAEFDYTDLVFKQYYNVDLSQRAMLQQSEDTPGYYRIVNAYSQSGWVHHDECNHYIIVDAQDPEWVAIPFSVTGIDAGGDGILTFGTCAALGYDKASGTARKLTSGTLNDRTITFPAGSLFGHEQFYDAPGSWSRINLNSVATLSLPEITVDVTVKDAAGRPVEGAVVSLVDEEDATLLAEDDETADDAAVESFVTGADGKTTVKVPFTNDYFKTVKLQIVKAEDGVSHVEELALNGANNTLAYNMTVTTGVDNVAIDDAKVEYFNMQGMRISQPSAGQVVIKRQGNKVSKVLMR